MRVDIDGLWYDGKLVMKWVDPSDVATRERVIAEYKEIQRLADLDDIGVEYELRDRIIAAVESCF